MLKNTNTNALSGKCLLTETKWGSKHLEGSVMETSECCGSLCKTTSLCNGGLEIEESGEGGYEITPTSFNEKGWE